MPGACIGAVPTQCRGFSGLSYDRVFFRMHDGSRYALLLPDKEVPESVKFVCQGEWEFDREFSGFSPQENRVGIDAAKAIGDILNKGFHIARFVIGDEDKNDLNPEQ